MKPGQTPQRPAELQKRAPKAARVMDVLEKASGAHLNGIAMVRCRRACRARRQCMSTLLRSARDERPESHRAEEDARPTGERVIRAFRARSVRVLRVSQVRHACVMYA